jgi:hypothetical protein
LRMLLVTFGGMGGTKPCGAVEAQRALSGMTLMGLGVDRCVGLWWLGVHRSAEAPASCAKPCASLLRDLRVLRGFGEIEFLLPGGVYLAVVSCWV